MSNRPKPGSIIAVDPIRTLKNVALIMDTLKDNLRDFTLFTLGVNTNLRAGDLLGLTKGSIDFEQSRIVVREKKTKKIRNIDLGDEMKEILCEYCIKYKIITRDQLLFPSRKGGGPLTVSSLHRLVNMWCSNAGLTGHYGSHTLRKTWSFIQYTEMGTDLALISEGLNHSSMDTTYAYLGMNSEAKKSMYTKFIGRR